MTRNRLTLDERRVPWYKDRGNQIIIILIAIGSGMILGSQFYTSSTRQLVLNDAIIINATKTIQTGFENLTQKLVEDIEVRKVGNEKTDVTNNLIINLTNAITNNSRYDPVVASVEKTLSNITKQHKQMMEEIEKITNSTG